jgi:hypothetical protein
VILDASDGKYTVLSAKGTEVWKPEDCRRGGNPATGVTYAVRALEVVKTREAAATTDLEVLRRSDARQRELITRVAHTQGSAHGLDSRLDDMLARNGLERRPVPMHRWVAIHARHIFDGTTPATSVGAVLGTDVYQTFGRVPQRIVADRIRMIQMPSETLPFRTVDECTCESECPPIEAVQAQWENTARLGPGWRTEILGHRMAFTTESRSGNGCRHQTALSQVATWEEAFPAATPFPVTLTDHSLAAYLPGDTVRITRNGHEMQVGWEFRVESVRSDGRLIGRSDEHTTYGHYVIRPANCVRVNIRVGDQVRVTTRHSGLAVGETFTVTAETVSGNTLMYECTNVGGMPGWLVQRQHVERVTNLSPIQAAVVAAVDDDEPF